MSWRLGAALVAISLFLTACIGSQRATTPTPGEDDNAAQQVGQRGLNRIPSAATPGMPAESVLAGADRILEQVRAAIEALDLFRAEPGYKEFRIEAPRLVFTCLYSPGGADEAVPLLACKFGEFVNTVTGHALFWHDGTAWRAQFYPEAPIDLSRKRYAYFEPLGENCPIGCGSLFRAIRQSGRELLAVVDLSGVSTRWNQEVHLLKRDEEQWHLVWVPDPETYSFKGHPRVTLPDDTIGRFVVSYDDGASVTWVRQGAGYVRGE